MVFGDGDGQIFTDFTGSLDVIAHELTHGVTEYTAGLEYHEPVRRAERVDVRRVRLAGQAVGRSSRRADQADWLIGAEVFTPDVDADALRSMKAPGTAFDNELLGKDPQPDHMDRLRRAARHRGRRQRRGAHQLRHPEQGVLPGRHVGIGGNAWEAPGHIWYESLRASTATTRFMRCRMVAAISSTDTEAEFRYGIRCET